MLTKQSALSKDQRNASKPVMEHRHFAVVAGVLADLDDATREQVALHFAAKLAATNPKFNKARFMAACNV
jgi:hypothetical protein